MDETDDVEPSLDTLSQAFAAAMGRELPEKPDDSGKSEEPRPSAARPKQRKATVVEVCPISPKSILEAILFVGHPENEPIDAHRVASLLRGVDADEVEKLIQELNDEYEQQELPFSIQAAGDGYQLELRPEFEHIQERFYGRIRHARLTQFAVDILAVVAYNQPVTREELEKLLNDSPPTSRILNQLVRRDLLACRTIGDKPKRREYVTTERFLDLFHLSDISDLPRTEDPQ